MSTRISCLTVCLCLPLLLMGGCPCGPVVSVRGFASYTEPVAGATVTVVSGDEIVFSEVEETTVNGTFLLKVPQNLMGTAFTLEVSEGFVGSEPFTGILRADVEDFSSESHTYIDVNAVTTLVAAFRDANPEVSLDECVAQVKEFLEIPEEVDIHTDLVGWERYFDLEVFAADLAGSGLDFNGFIDALVTEMGSSNGTHPFQHPEMAKGLGSDLAFEVIKGAASELGSMGMGWLCSELFGDPDEDRLEEISNQLTQISQQLDNINMSINNLRQDIRSMTATVLTAQEQQSYNVIAAMLSNDVAAIDSAMDLYYYLVKHVEAEAPDEELQQDAADLIAAIGPQGKDIAAAMNHINQVLLGTIPSSQGMYNLIDDVLYAKSFNTKHFSELNQIYDFWAQVQIKGLALLMEYAHQKYPTNPAQAIGVRDNYLNALNAQSNLYLRATEKQLSHYYSVNESLASTYYNNYSHYGPNIPGYAPLTDCDPLRNADARVAAVLGKQNVVTLHLFADWTFTGATTPALNETMSKVGLINVATNEIYEGDVAARSASTHYGYYTFDTSAWAGSWSGTGPSNTTGAFIRAEFIGLPPGTYRITGAFNASYWPGSRIAERYMSYNIGVGDADPIRSFLISLVPF